MRARLLLVAFAAFSLVGCSKAAETSPIGLPMEVITIDTDHGPQTLQVEIAADDKSREYGLMNRKTMEDDHGMLFDFQQVLGVAFWMKNTPMPLDMLFVRPDGSIASIAPNATPYSTQEIQATEPVRAVIELKGGEAEALGIVPGDVVHAKAFGNAKP